MFEVEKRDFVSAFSAMCKSSGGVQVEQVRRLFTYKNFIKRTQLSISETGFKGFQT